MVYKNIKKRTFEIIQASTEHDLASKIFDICLIVLVNQKESESCLENLTKWANQNSYKNVSAGGSLGEWVYRTRKNIFKYEYPEGFEKPDGTKPDIIMSLSPNAAQDKTRWRIPAEFPCCPTELTETPLQDYFENLKQGKIFCRNKQYSSSVLETALYKDNIIVKTENCEINIFSIPVCSSSFNPTLGFSVLRILQNSSRNLSVEMPSTFFRIFSCEIASNVFSSISNPSCPENLIALTGRSPSSENRSNGSPTVLIIFL